MEMSKQLNMTEKSQVATGFTADAHTFGPRIVYFHMIQFGGFAAVLYFLLVSQVGGWWWALALFSYFCTTCLGMAITFHRSLSHRLFALPKPLEYLFSWFGAMGGTGSTIAWIAVHREHDAHPDTDKAPHAPGKFGWRLLFSGYEHNADWRRVCNLLRDPFHVLLHRYYALIIFSWAAVLFVIHPYAFFFGFLIPASGQITITNASAIVGHKWGYTNYEMKDNSKNNPLMAALTWGEGWHNNHHGDPRAWNQRVKWWELDPAGWIIAAMTKTGIIKRESFLEL